MRPVVIVLASGDARDIDPAVREASQLTKDVMAVSDGAGYGNDLRVGLTHAAESDFTHAIILDVSRRHPISDLPRLLETIKPDGTTIVNAFRPRPHTLPQRLIRAWADFWTWTETGRWLHDSAYGLRAYPLPRAAEIATRSKGFEADVELLVKSMWAGASVVELKLSEHQDAIGAMRINDVHRFAMLTNSLAMQRLLLPPPLREMMHRKPFAHLPLGRRIKQIIRDGIHHNCNRPGTFAAGVGVGVFFGILPVWGFQMLLAATVAHLLGLSKQLVLVASQVSFPALVPFILYGSLMVGHLLHNGTVGGLPRLHELRPSMQLLTDYLAGSIVLAVVGALVAGTLAYVTAASIRAIRPSA